MSIGEEVQRQVHRPQRFARTVNFACARANLAARNGDSMTEKTAISRRKLLADSAVTAAAFSIVPRHVLGRGVVPPSDTLNIAGVGVGGMGLANLINLASQNNSAVCDVDWGYAGKALDRLDTDIDKLRTRIEAPAPAPAPGQPPIEFD